MSRDKRTLEEKARALVEQSQVRQDANFTEIWWVPSSDGSKQYRVQVGQEYMTCTCPHGMHKGGGDPSCYHVRAVRMALEEGTR